MITYLFKRLIGLVPVLIGISFITFLVIHLAPGDPGVQSDLNPKVSLQARQKMLELYGLNRPLHVQYLDWAQRIVRLDFGESFKDGEPVIRKIAKRIPVTLTINILSLALILFFALPIGVLGAMRPGSWADRSIALFVYVGFAVPGFWLALLLMSLFGVRLHWLPIAGLTSLEHEFMGPLQKFLDTAQHLILPLFVSAFTGMAGISRYMRQSMLEVLNQDYLRTAWSKGLSPARVIIRHGMRNALLPIITILGLSVPGLLGGSVIFESIFSIPGMGRLFFDAVYARDFPVIMGVLMIGAFLTLAGNLLADLAYYWADPRIRLDAKR